MIAKIVRGAHSENALVAADQKHPFQQAAALVVEEIFVPAAFHQLGNDHDDTAIGMLVGQFQNVLNDRNNNEAIRRREHQQFRRFRAGAAERSFDIPFPIDTEQF